MRGRQREGRGHVSTEEEDTAAWSGGAVIGWERRGGTAGVMAVARRADELEEMAAGRGSGGGMMVSGGKNWAT
jgi:hypothetical protein